MKKKNRSNFELPCVMVANPTMYSAMGNCMEDVMFGGQRVGAPKLVAASRAGVRC